MAVIVQTRCAVHRIFGKGAGGQLHLVIDLEIPGQQGTGLKVVDDTAGTLLAVLVTPVGIVLTVVGQPVSLVGRGTLLSAFSGITPGGEVQRMFLVDDLLYGHEISQTVIEGSLHSCRVHVCPTIAHGGEECPSAVGHTGTVGVHGTSGIVTVDAGEGHLVARGKFAGTELIVAATTEAAHAKGIGLEGEGRVLVASRIVHTTYGRIVELAVLQVVDLYAVHVDVIVL